MEEAFYIGRGRIAGKHLPVPIKNTGIPVLKLFLTFVIVLKLSNNSHKLSFQYRIIENWAKKRQSIRFQGSPEKLNETQFRST